MEWDYVSFSLSWESRQYKKKKGGYTNEELYEIERKEEVYGLGILIMEILLGCFFIEGYISFLHYLKHLDFDVLIPNELQKDEVIVDIVEDCLLRVEVRPTIKEVLRRLKEWERIPTPPEKQLKYRWLSVC